MNLWMRLLTQHRRSRSDFTHSPSKSGTVEFRDSQEPTTTRGAHVNPRQPTTTHDSPARRRSHGRHTAATLLRNRGDSISRGSGHLRQVAVLGLQQRLPPTVPPLPESIQPAVPAALVPTRPAASLHTMGSALCVPVQRCRRAAVADQQHRLVRPAARGSVIHDAEDFRQMIRTGGSGHAVRVEMPPRPRQSRAVGEAARRPSSGVGGAAQLAL